MVWWYLCKSGVSWREKRQKMRGMTDWVMMTGSVGPVFYSTIGRVCILRNQSYIRCIRVGHSQGSIILILGDTITSTMIEIAELLLGRIPLGRNTIPFSTEALLSGGNTIFCQSCESYESPPISFPFKSYMLDVPTKKERLALAFLLGLLSKNCLGIG